MSTLHDVLSRYQNSLSFRDALKKNPEQALKDEGLTVSAEDLLKIEAMLNIDPSKNEKLDDRISK